jgi:Holliday junction resolvase RusA-like endonuclease
VTIQLIVLGLPAPQGSKKFVGFAKSTGRAIMVESSAKTKPWRLAVQQAAFESGQRLAGPVAVSFVFTMPKPKSAPKTRRTWPDRKPDIDKLCRSTLDGLVEGGVIEDDARVVRLSCAKVFPGEDPQALTVPGLRVSIVAIGANAAEPREYHSLPNNAAA